MREDRKKNRNSGFTLVEVMIAVAILAIISIPVLQSFVSVAQVNSKSRRRLSATTIAENLMESCKGISLKEVAAQCDNLSPAVPITIVAGNLEAGTAFAGSAQEVNFALTNTISGSNKTVSYDSTNGYVFHAKSDGKYAFWVRKIQSGGASYDAIIKYELDATRSRGAAGGSTETTLNAAGVNVMKFYKVTIMVYRSASDLTSLTTADPIASIEGSVTDYSK